MPENSNRLKQLRLSKKLTLVELARKSGIPRATLSRYENNKSEPKREVWEKLAAMFGVSTAYMLGFTDNPSRTNGDDSRLTDEFKTMDNMKIFFDVAFSSVANSDNLDSDTVNALDYLLTSLGTVLSNFDRENTTIDNVSIEHLAKIINLASFLALGYPFDSDPNTKYMNHMLTLSDDEAFPRIEDVKDDIKTATTNLANNMVKNIHEINSNDATATYLNTLAFGG